jgi:hypothetical protein
VQLFPYTTRKKVGWRIVGGCCSHHWRDSSPHLVMRSLIIAGSVDTVSTSAVSTKSSDGVTSPKVQKLARQKWTVNRGYSSGASSYGSNEDDEIESADGFDPKSIPRPIGLSARNISEASRLSDLREELSTCELAKSVVRIEVCRVSFSSKLHDSFAVLILTIL